MLDITVIILTKNEEKNIEKSILSAKQIARRIVVIDSGSTDQTIELAKKNGAEVFFHEWCGHAKQFNWALECCEILTEWVFRLDADERISKELAKEIKEKLNSSEKTDAYEMRFKLYFMNKWIRHGGTHKIYLLRLFRFGKGYVEERMMDERIIVEGYVGKLENDLIHYDYKGLDNWLNKHIWYSDLEIQMLYSQYNIAGENKAQKMKRGFYYQLPLFFRAKMYYLYRYYIQLGFLDGREGKIFIYLQAYWYRFLIDVKLFEKGKRA